MSDTAVSASAKGATFLILLQTGSRALTFALNQVLLRFLSPELLGVSVQLELYCISVLYFSRESLRIAAQRQVENVQAAINLSYLAILAGAPLAYGLAELYLHSEVPRVPYLLTALRLYGLAAMVELLSEPGFVAAQQSMLYKVRASAEATAVIMKTITTCGLVIWAAREGRDLGVLPFAVGQLAYAGALLLVYISQTINVAARNGFALYPCKIDSRQSNQYFLGHLSKSLLSLASSLYVQSGIKYVLTQGDSLLIAALASLEDQGSYALSSNYGGLIARMLFQPIEDSSRNLFARLAAKVPTEKSNANSKPEKNGEGTSPGQDGIRQANRILRDILKIYTLMSLFAFALGPTMAPLLLKLVAGSRWSDTSASDVLGTYCYYIPLLAINGVTEAFVAATATSAELGAQSVWMGVFFAAFAGSAYLFLRVLEMGAKGLVLANCVNMAARILFNFSFLSKFFDRHREHFDILSVLPRGSTIAVSVTVPAVIRVTDGLLSMYGFVGELVRMGGVSVAMLGATAFCEREHLRGVYKMLNR